MIQVEISYGGGEQERDLRIYLARQPIKVLTLSKFQNCVMSVPQIHDTHIDKIFWKVKLQPTIHHEKSYSNYKLPTHEKGSRCQDFFSFLLCGCISNLYVDMHTLTHLLVYSMIHNSLCLRNLYLRATLRYKFTWESSFPSIEHMQFSKSSPLLVNGMILKSFARKTSYVSEQLW